MLRLSPISTPTDTLIPYTTLFRSPRMMKQGVQRDASVRRSTRSGRVKEYFYGNPLADRQFAPSRLALFFHDVALFRVPAGALISYVFAIANLLGLICLLWWCLAV